MSNGHEESRTESNGLGLAGFIVSLVGLVGSCGLLSPIGLIMSLIAMRKRPKGFAIAGVVIGLLGTFWLIVAILFAFTIIAAVLGVMVAAMAAITLSGLPPHTFEILDAMENHYEATGQLPATLAELSALSNEDLQDAYGNPFRYEIVEGGDAYTITSNGPDGQPDTGDETVVYLHVASPKRVRLTVKGKEWIDIESDDLKFDVDH